MRKMTAILLAGVLMMSLAACGKTSSGVPDKVQKQVDQVVEDLTGTGENASGGWSKPDSEDLTDEEKEIFEDAVADDPAEYTPIAVEATQIVAGINYCFLCQVTADGESKYQLMYVYRDLNGNSEITDTQILEE